MSVIVAARNEAENIGRCLGSLIRQNYPAEKLEIIVIDDASTDTTALLVSEAAKKYRNITLIRQQEHERGMAPKKQAIQKGVTAAHGEIIFSIDADCYAQSEWIATMLSYFTPETGVVFGFAGFAKDVEQGLFLKIQSLEYLTWFGLAAGFAGVNRPTMCNANNLAYRKAAFFDVNGFAGIDGIPSGDDELLMQKIKDQTKWSVAFCSDLKAMNYTAPCKDVKSFINQRSRWASKGLLYKRSWLRALLTCVFAFYLSLIVLLAASVIHFCFFKYFLVLFAAKCVIDFFVVFWAAQKTGRTDLLKIFPFAAPFHLFYIPLVSVRGSMGKYKWKKE